jgi:hypothetical protein
MIREIPEVEQYRDAWHLIRDFLRSRHLSPKRATKNPSSRRTTAAV